MSKETAVVALGALIVVTTQLGIPASWRTAIIILAGIALVVIGFFLRAEALSRGIRRTPPTTFVESGAPAESHSHEQKGGITSLN